MTAAIFDLDGTLADTMPVHRRAWLDAAARFALSFDEPRFFALAGMPTLAIARLLVAEQAAGVDPAIVADAKEAAFLARFDEIGPLDPVIEIARRRRHEGPIAVGSGNTRDLAMRTLRRLGIDGWFAAVVAAEDTPRHKPEPDVFLEAARRIGVAPAACTVYEDADLGLEAARRAGMLAVDVRPLVTAWRR
jgi:beta-phosphoglucomutase-like phosphatase (HAD superfamily)